MKYKNYALTPYIGDRVISGRTFKPSNTLEMASRAKLTRAAQLDAARRTTNARVAAANASAGLQALQNQIDANTRMLAAAIGGGGVVSGGDRRMNMSPYVRPSQPGKGGVLPTEAATFATSEAANTTVSVAVADSVRARLTGTVIEGITAIGTGQLASASEQAKVEFSVFVNGQTEAEAFRVPLDQCAGTLDGPQILPVDIYIGADVEVTVDFTTILALADEGGGDVFLRFWCGDGTTFSVKAGY